VLEGEAAEREVKKIARLADRERRAGRDGQAFRFRNQLAPAGWLAVALAGLAARAAGLGWLTVAVALALTCGVTWAASRGASRFASVALPSAIVWACCQAGIMWYAGVGWWTGIGLIGWGMHAAPWIEHYGWSPRPQQPDPPESDADIFAELCEVQKWHARLLLPARRIPHGLQYEIRCNGRRTPFSKIAARPEEIAAAFGARPDECYAEPHPSGEAHRGLLTRLGTATLEQPREWDGSGVDLAAGTARAGRFADGTDARALFWKNGKGGGIKHFWLSGCDGSGKTSLLDLLLCIATATRDRSGRGLIAPVILDPQDGQALPAWMDHLPTARGIAECAVWVDALYEAMFARSRQLAGFRWKLLADKRTAVPADDPRPGSVRKGIGFFDPVLTGLPVIMIVIDECPILLAVPGIEDKLTKIAKLGRKAGFMLVMAAQVPSVKEMKSAELRSILNGGNQFMFRAGDRVSGGMMNMPADPNKIAKFFRNGQQTEGLGYASTLDARPTVPFRADYEPDPYEVAERADIARADGTVAARMREVIAAADASAEQLARLADEQEQAKLTLLGLLEDGPAEQGDLAVRSGIRPSVLAAALAAAVAEGTARRDGSRVEAVR